MLDLDRPNPVDVPDAPTHFAWRLKLLSPQEFTSLPNKQAYLSSFGHLAPTTHNSQPQRFQFNKDDSITVYLDREFILPASDKVGRQATISIGCVLGNIDVASRSYGLKMQTEILESRRTQSRYLPMVKIHFTKNKEPLDSNWLKAILARKVVRSQSQPGFKLSLAIKTKMQEIIKRYQNLELKIIEDNPDKLAIATLQQQADAIVIKNREFFQELGNWLLENDSKSYLGIRGSEFGLNDSASIRFSKGLKASLTSKDALRADEINGLAMSGKIQVYNSGAVAVILAKTDDPQSRIEAGRAFSELSLLLQINAIYVSIRAALSEVNFKNYKLPMVESLKARLKTAKYPEMLFTIGIPKNPKDLARPHSSRLPLEEVLLPTS